MKPCLTALSRFVCVFAFLLLLNILNYQQSAMADGPVSAADSPASNISQIGALTSSSTSNSADEDNLSNSNVDNSKISENNQNSQSNAEQVNGATNQSDTPESYLDNTVKPQNKTKTTQEAKSEETVTTIAANTSNTSNTNKTTLTTKIATTNAADATIDAKSQSNEKPEDRQDSEQVDKQNSKQASKIEGNTQEKPEEPEKPEDEPEENLKPISPYSKVNHNPIINPKSKSSTASVSAVSIIKPEESKDKYDVLEPVREDEEVKKRPPCRVVKRQKQDIKDYNTKANEGRKYIDGSDAAMVPEKHSDDELEYEDCEPENPIVAALPENKKESQILGDGTLVNKPILASSNQVISGFSMDLSGGVSAYQLGGNTFSGLGNESISYYRYIKDWYLEASLEASQFIGGSSQFISQGIGGSVGHKFEAKNVMIVPFFGISLSGTIRVSNGIYDGAYFGTSVTVGMSLKPKESIFGWSTSLSSGYFTINNYALNNMATINYRNSLLIQPKKMPVLFNVSVAFMSGFRHGGGEAFAESLTGGISFKL